MTITVKEMVDKLKQYPGDVEIYIMNYDTVRLDDIDKENIKYHNSHNYIVIGEK